MNAVAKAFQVLTAAGFTDFRPCECGGGWFAHPAPGAAIHGKSCPNADVAPAPVGVPDTDEGAK